MPAVDEPALGPEYCRDVAARLRQIAGEMRFDHGRAAQLRALADAFERRADRLERELANNG